MDENKPMDHKHNVTNAELFSTLVSVFIFCAYGKSIRKIMLNLFDLGMITRQYAFFTFEVLPENCIGNDGRNKNACEAFEGLMDIGNYLPATNNYWTFENNVRKRMPEFAGLGHHMTKQQEVGCVGVFWNNCASVCACI